MCAIQAQYTEIINSKRPGLAESPYSVGKNIYQVESGFFYKKSNSSVALDKPKTIGGKLFLRTGKFFENLEFNANITYREDEINPQKDFLLFLDAAEGFGNVLPFIPIKTKGVSALTFGIKYLFYQQKYTNKSKEIRSWKRRMAFDKKRLIPSVGLYAGVHTNLVSSSYKNDVLSYKAAVLLQNDFSDRLVVITNLIADNIGSKNNFYTYLLTATYAVNHRWSFFIESQGDLKKVTHPKQQFGTGIAYLFSPNLQFDTSIRSNFLEINPFLQASVGMAWRLDRHSDEIISKNSPRNLLAKKQKRNNGNFFTRLFKKRN